MKQQTKIASSSKTDEYYTPEWILEYARRAFKVDQFDYDPLTAKENPTKAKYFTALPEDGFSSDWKLFDNVWINPPFSKMSHLADKIYTDDLEGTPVIILTKADFRTGWSRRLLKACSTFVVVNDYVQFIGAKNSALYSVVLWTLNVPIQDLKDAAIDDPRFIVCTREN